MPLFDSDKVENGGATPQGRLSAAEANLLAGRVEALPVPLGTLTQAELDAANQIYPLGRVIKDQDGLKVADGVKTWRATPYLFSRKRALHAFDDCGVVGSDTPGGVVDNTETMRAALTQACNEGRQLIVPAGHYFINSLIQQTKSVDVIGSGGVAKFLGGSTVGASGTMFRFDPGSMGGGWLVTTDILPGSRTFGVSTTTGLVPGLAFNLRSQLIWPYDGRDMWVKGETQIISKVDEVNSRVTIRGVFRDRYTVASDAPSLNVGQLIDVTMADLSFEFLTGAADQALVGLTRCRATLENITFRRAGLQGMSLQRCVGLRANRILAENIGNGPSPAGDNVGYGMSVSACLDSVIENFTSYGCRRGIDIGGTQTAGPSRDTTVIDFYIEGGGRPGFGSNEFIPDGTTPCFGIGMHGPCDGARFSRGRLVNVDSGITVRGLDSIIEDIVFIGRVKECVYATFGEGLVVERCKVESLQGSQPLVTADIAAPATFIRFGGGGSGPSRWKYNRPTTIRGNIVHGLVDSFITLDNQGPIGNLSVHDNDIVAATGSGTFALIKGVNGGGEILNGVLGPNTFQRQYSSGTILVVDANVGIALTAGNDNVVSLGGGRFVCTIPVNDTKIIRLAQAWVLPGSAIKVQIACEDASLCGDFMIAAVGGAAVPTGLVGSNLTVVAGPLTGSSGATEKVNIALSASALTIENRRGVPKTLYISIS